MSHSQDSVCFLLKSRIRKSYRPPLTPGGKVRERQRSVDWAQRLLRLQRGSRLLSGSSPSSPRVPWRPWPSAGCKKLCLVTRCFPLPPPSMEKASGVSAASSSRDEGAGAEEAGGGLTLGIASGTGWWLAGGGVQGETTSRPLGGGGEWVGEVRGGLKEEGGWGSVGRQEYWSCWTSPSDSRSGKIVPACSSRPKGASMAGSVALGGRMLSLAMVAWMELIGMSPPRTISCWDSCLE